MHAIKSMDPGQLNGNNGDAISSSKKILDLKPARAGASGVGLPYAPAGWPHPGDNWTWSVGHRKTLSGHWIDRSLHPPNYFPKISGCKARFQSRISLRQYIRKEFPNADVDAFFASFAWKVPACTGSAGIENHLHKEYHNGILEENICPGSESAVIPGDCKVGNGMCKSVKDNDCHLKVKACDICCNESSFCRDCCCILCSGIVDSAHGGFSFIRCRAIVEEDLICGHCAHIECALRSHMAGTVGGSIGLDAEYYCRRCDNKTDLIQHVVQFIETCESLDSSDDIEKILNLGSCILIGSGKIRAKNLRNCIAAITSKLNRGINLGEIWKAKNAISNLTDAPPFSGKEIIILDSPENSTNNAPAEPLLNRKNVMELQGHIAEDHAAVSAKLEDQIDDVLRRLKDSQEFEYRTAEEKLYAQKDFLLGLYRQLEAERGELAMPTPLRNGGNSDDALLTSVLSRVDQIKREEAKLEQMMRVAGGFGRIPDSIVRQYFYVSEDY
ncbi:hypothetical protein KSP39_PZI012273 [Platanthera zijinensis]|uniref:Oberon PHD finger domain-containing protein n=1 Tax=Platanthera zijinensis TaxID=2320716 RepID=A0AAP0G4J8_9ASPA